MTSQTKASSKSSSLLFLLLVYAGLVGLYWVARYGGSAMEVDTMRVTLSGEGTLVSGRLINDWYYHAGYGFPAQLGFVSAVTGLPVQSIQLGSGIWIVAVALAAFASYRELLGSSRLAVLAVFLLLVQPDFIFYILRGSHEKATWLYALLLLFLAARSYRSSRQTGRLFAYILLFYAVFWAMTSTNAYFASSFITSLGISFLGGWLVGRWKPQQAGDGEKPALRRLAISALVCLVLVYILTTYAYPPAEIFYNTLVSILDRLSLLFLGAQAAEPYSYVQTAWIHPWVYLILTAVQWAISLASLAFWAFTALRLERGDRGRWLLWLMYTGFGTQLAFAILADYAGALSANLQVRQFTPFTLFSSPMAALLISQVAGRLGQPRVRFLRPAAAFLALAAALAMILKVTNDPLLGNQWMFYTPGELQAARWTDQKVDARDIWLDTTAHPINALAFWEGTQWETSNSFDWGYPQTPPPYVLISKLTRLRGNRSGLVLPSTNGYDQVYDNGDAQLFKRQPRTPYQR